MANKTFVIFRNESKWCSALLSVKAKSITQGSCQAGRVGTAAGRET